MKASRSLVCLFFACLAAWGQIPTSSTDVSELSIEQLLNVQVTSVSRKAQRLARAPAAVFVITQEDLRRSGVSSVAEALRMVPGMHVARVSGGSWAVSARGGAQLFANRMLVLVDGRSVYNNFFGGVFWQYLDMMMEDIDRIEVIRGPGCVMWGANAVNGVVNVITRSARRTVGTLVSASIGNQENVTTSLRHGAQFSTGAYRAWGKFGNHDLFQASSPVFQQEISSAGSRTLLAGSLPASTGSMLNAGFRVDWERGERNQFTVQGDYYKGSWQNTLAGLQLIPPYGVLTRIKDTPIGGNVQFRWAHAHLSGAETTTQVYYDGFEAEFPFSYRSAVIDVDVHQTRPIGESHELMWGFNFRHSRTALTPTFQAQTAQPTRSDPLFGLVVNDEIELVPQRLSLSLGMRVEHNNYTGLEFEPSIRSIYTPGKRHSLWAAWSRAVRTPTRAEHDISYRGFAGLSNGLPIVYESAYNPQFRSEKLYAHEGGYQYQSVKWNISASLFYNRYTDVRFYLPTLPSIKFVPRPYINVQALVTNNRRETNYGGEFWTMWSVHPRWKLMPSYSWLHAAAWQLRQLNALEEAFTTGSDPSHQVRLRSLFDLTRSWQFDASLYHTAAMPNLSIGAHMRMDLRLNWRPTRHQEWSVGVFDAAAPETLERPPEGPFLASIQRRAWQLKWVYKF